MYVTMVPPRTSDKLVVLYQPKYSHTIGHWGLRGRDRNRAVQGLVAQALGLMSLCCFGLW